MAHNKIGPVTIEFQHKGHRTAWRWSAETVVIDGYAFPTWVWHRRYGVDAADVDIRVELRNGSPRVVNLSFRSQRGGREVMEKDLRAVDIDRLAVEIYSVTIARFNPGQSRREEEQVVRLAERFIDSRRDGIPDEEQLHEVARIYSEHNGRAPRLAVANHFGVEPRIASDYVQRARRKGLLPPTKRGKRST